MVTDPLGYDYQSYRLCSACDIDCEPEATPTNNGMSTAFGRADQVSTRYSTRSKTSASYSGQQSVPCGPGDSCPALSGRSSRSAVRPLSQVRRGPAFQASADV